MIVFVVDDLLLLLLDLTRQWRLVARDAVTLDQNGVRGDLHSLHHLEDISHNDFLAEDLLLFAVVSNDSDLLVGALNLLQLLELLFFGIVITHGDNSDDKNGEEDRGALNPAIFEPIINNADDQRDKGGK